jgi:rhodanese-related sulfurtransferase
MSTLRQALLLIALSALAAAGTHLLHPQAPAWYLVEEKLEPGEVSLAMIQELWQGKVLWIDARSEDRYQQEHIPEALLLNEEHFDQQLFDLIEKLQSNTLPVVVYCDAQKCQASKKVRDALKERVGLPQVHVLRGGWPAWASRKTS